MSGTRLTLEDMTCGARAIAVDDAEFDDAR